MKKGLGKGLDALFSGSSVPTGADDRDQSSIMVRISDIEPNPQQPRRDFDEDKIEELRESILEHGVITPIVIRSIAEGRYQIIAGERRWRASKLAGLSQIPAIIKDCSEKEGAEMALVENLQREDLNPIEEANGYRLLMEEFEMTQEQVSKRIGKSRPQIANTLRLLQLDEKVVRLVGEGRLSAGHARALIPLGTAAAAAAQKVLENELSVRETENLVKKLQRPEKLKEQRPFTEDVFFSLEKELSARLSSKVKITGGKNKGKIEIEYYGNDDLDRILSLLK